MPLQQIKRRYTEKVLFECEVTAEQKASGIAVRVALEKAASAGANLSGAYLAGAYLDGANLAGAYLAGANLSGAYLAGANLSDANLSGANLAGAYLSGANLAGAYLADAYLDGANLADANLAGANLADANLAGAYLAGANLAGAKWCGGVTINRAPLTIDGLLWRVCILDHHMQIGCELHPLADWASFDDARIVHMDGRDALRFWRAHKTTLLALAAADGRGVKVEEAEAA